MRKNSTGNASDALLALKVVEEARNIQALSLADAKEKCVKLMDWQPSLSQHPLPSLVYRPPRGLFCSMLGRPADCRRRHGKLS